VPPLDVSSRYDVVIAGARCAGASTALLLARRGLRVLVVDPMRRGSDTLSTHAVMRGGVLQLSRWGLLDAIRSAGTPPIRTTSFHYGDDRVDVVIEPRDGIDALYAPRRTVLDRVLIDAAADAGAEVLLGHSVVGVVRDSGGRVRGARLAGADRSETVVAAELLVGADGVRSRVARLVAAGVDYAVHHAATAIYGYWRGMAVEGNQWFHALGATVGTIPTNDSEHCVFVLLPQGVLRGGSRQELDTLHREGLRKVSPLLAQEIAAAERRSGLRAFAGIPGFLRRSAGPGWALVGDAGYFKDPITAHGITDALRDAELLARAVAAGGDDELVRYQARRDALVKGLLDITDRLASLSWSLDEAKDLHVALSREMKAEVEQILAFGPALPV
jgi:2-polyprenyl-6-methoxyphenol hydroxylase-like FAD-dependent oxidoreductase